MDELGRALARWLLDAGVIDDITGASLEAGWFRSSRQSLFGSSAPPLRTSIAESNLPNVASPPVPIIRSLRPAPLAALTPLLRAARAQLASLLARLAEIEPSRRKRIGVLAALAIGTVFAWIGFSAFDRAPAENPPAALGTAAVELDDPTPSADLSGLSAWPAPAFTLLPEAVPEAAAPPAEEVPAPAGAPIRETRSRAKAKKTGDHAARSESKEHRRSKLIDPYR
jgi:hypothetical protein